MRILQVIHSANPNSGGPIEAVRQLSQALITRGHVVELACLDEPGNSWERDFPLKLYCLGPGTKGYGYSRWFAPWLLKHSSNYDCVVVNGLWQYTSFGTWHMLRLGKIPYFIWPHGMLDPWFKFTYPFKHFKKWVYWLGAEYKVLRDAQAVLFTCEEERLMARHSFCLYRCNEVVVNFGTSTPSGCAQDQRRAFLSRFPQLQDKRLMLFLGRIHPKKGCELLIKAFAQTASLDDSLHLVMAGPDQTGWQAELRRLTQNLNIERRVTWTGMLSGNLKWGAFNAAEVFVLPSHQENFGVAVVEALACGVPVLISNKVNIWREIEADGAGLVADDSFEGTVDLLQQWLALPLHQKRLMQKQAKQSFIERFEIHQAAQEFIKVLHTHGIEYAN